MQIAQQKKISLWYIIYAKYAFIQKETEKKTKSEGDMQSMLQQSRWLTQAMMESTAQNWDFLYNTKTK